MLSSSAKDTGITQPQKTFVYTGQPAYQIPRDVTHVIIHPSVRKVEDGAFRECVHLVEVVFSSGLQIIGKFAFYKCFQLRSISLPSTLVKICDCAFAHCVALVHIKLKDKAIQDIGSGAFQWCRKLLDAQLPQHLSVISDGLFANCLSLRRISIPKGVAVIGQRSFANCTSLVHVEFHDNLQIIGNKAFADCESLLAIPFPTSIVSIGKMAFLRCHSLTDVHFPEGLMWLGEGAFSGCQSLRSVSTPTTLNAIENSTFGRCPSLVDVDLNEGLERIGVRAFSGASSLSAIALPRSLNLVDAMAFDGCLSLLGVEIPLNTDLMMAQHHGTFSTPVCFSECSSLINVCIPSTMTYHVDDAFSECDLFLDEENNYEYQPEKLRNRFVNLPVHEICYYSSAMKKEDLRNALESGSCPSSSDNFDMTPFHIIATGAKLREDMLELLLDKYPVSSLWAKDQYGRTMMDYLLMNHSSKATPLIKMVLQKAMAHEMNGWGLSTWKLDLSRRVELVPSGCDIRKRRQSIDDVMDRFAFYMGVEMTSILELAAWKIAINQLRPGEQDRETDRADSRMRCGSEVVLDNVMGYLMDLESKEPLVSAFEPLCSSLYGSVVRSVSGTFNVNLA